MKSLHIELWSILAVALIIPACEAKSVPAWPYTLPSTGDEDAATPEGDAAGDTVMNGGAAADAASDDGGAAGAAGQSGSSGPSISDNYTIPPLRCDGGFCDTDNFSLCNLAGNAAASRSVWPLSMLAAIGAISVVRKRRRRRAEGS